jgi:predicted N-acetyltransferase YhbS
MKITTLKAAPHLLNSTIALIERAFEYKKPNSFAVDFAPLVSESNFHNCFIMIDESENVIAHIGVCERNILGIPVAMLGGIAVDESRRGEGHFKELIQDVMAEKRNDVAFFILWSDQEELYKKYGFHLCGMQIEVTKSGSSKAFEKTKLSALSVNQLNQLQNLYTNSFATLYSTIERSPSAWQDLMNIQSTDLYIKESAGNISDYFFMNKGQDLSNIIFEYGTTGDIKELIKSISPYGNVWLGSNLINDGEAQYQFFLAPGDTKLFAQFIKLITNEKIIIRDINPMKQEVYFYFNEELLALDTEEFLRGVLGPAPFEELGEMKPIFISGLDSI